MRASYWSRIHDATEDLLQKKDIKIDDIYSIIKKIKKNNHRIDNSNIDNSNIDNYINNINNFNNINNLSSLINKNNESSFIKIIFMLVKKIKYIESNIEELEKQYYNLIWCQPGIISCTVTREDESLNKCCICMDNEKEYAYTNCGHMCVCKDCQQDEWQHTCPLCKTPGNCIKIFT